MNTQDIPPNTEPPVAFEPPQTFDRRLHWPWFTFALLLPPVLTFVTIVTRAGDAAAYCALGGSGVAGLVCGVLLGRRLGKTTVTVALLSMLFVCIFAVVCFAMCFGGCLAGAGMSGKL